MKCLKNQTTTNNFFEQVLVQTQEIISDNIEKVWADETYHSAPNREYCQNDGHNIDLMLIATQGATPRYEISFDEQD